MSYQLICIERESIGLSYPSTKQKTLKNFELARAESHENKGSIQSGSTAIFTNGLLSLL